MKILIFSDVHGNLEAFESVLEDADRSGYEFALSLGDHVGYGANPNECIQAFAGLSKYAAIRGNHDAAALDPDERLHFNADAYAAIVHTARNLSEESREFLENLPLIYDSNRAFMGVHSSPNEPASWGYILDALEATNAFRCMYRPIAFTGHSHIPCIIAEEGDVRPLHHGDEIKIDVEHKCIINVGSVGQPRDRDPKAAYVFFDDTEKILTFRRVEYDWNRAALKILNSGLPPSLAKRIILGL
ncbi:MAG: metallophosphoesterase [Candidatus Latescibacteria bacterium]|nr:metallophosphoesterase [Candidatus Latescibacterota bacterium]NIM21101.1 metallophosphoesterase [Candidatus Latescibacterota bacterium]NIM65236.1 metallophosphoesterase [Candidatus Latescibacterota bacterium]NIO01751.1 metallophosphoesterase [Candidatus Latescibacterota bacterium]NIO28268.1 metallophosphoesterase [Candidatus Latescibacterota bacterium]